MAQRTVLVVSGDGERLDRLHKALADDFHIVTADVTTGLETFRATRACVALLDWSDATDDTAERHLDDLTEIRRDTATSVIVTVPAPARRLGAHALRQGAWDVLVEPIDVDLLRLLVARAAARCAASWCGS